MVAEFVAAESETLDPQRRPTSPQGQAQTIRQAAAGIGVVAERRGRREVARSWMLFRVQRMGDEQGRKYLAGLARTIRHCFGDLVRR